MSSTALSEASWTTWPRAAKLRLLAAARAELWRQTARPEQLEPDGQWRVWYVRGGRGSGKTRTGAETLAGWILGSETGEWAIVAPTFGDAKSVCVEGQAGLLKALGGLGGAVANWNRSEGVLYLENGSQVFVDGADDGALRIQGRNLRGAWCDEVGLWRDWDRAWNQSLAFAVRFDPGRLVATGTPKMGHPLVARLLSDPLAIHTHMRTVDNVANLDAGAVSALMAEYEGTTLGRQELDGEFIEALEGALLHRSDWRYYPPGWSIYARGQPDYSNLPAFTQIVHSWDTAFKDKTSSDFVAGQVWGVHGSSRYLLRLFHGQVGMEATKQQIREYAVWAHEVWPRCPHRILVEATANGPDIIAELRREIQGLFPVRAVGDKAQRAWAASPALEGHHCFLPGQVSEDSTSYDGQTTPAPVQALVEEAALFRADLKHAYDDQVDAWSQMVNWTRLRGGGQPAKFSSPASHRLPRPLVLPGGSRF